MNKDIYIFVEGIADEKFVSSYIDYLKLKFDCNRIKGTNGIDEKKFENLLREIPGEKIIIAIIDANSDRNKNIEIACKGFKIEKCQVFTFPNNDDKTGTLEDLLKKICVKDSFFNCFDKYQECLKKAKLKTQDKKTKIYSYDKATGGDGKEKEREYNNKERYNLDHESLKPLKDFLIKHLSKLPEN